MTFSQTQADYKLSMQSKYFHSFISQNKQCAVRENDGVRDGERYGKRDQESRIFICHIHRYTSTTSSEMYPE